MKFNPADFKVKTTVGEEHTSCQEVADMKYFFEYICDGPEAAGHGCGASTGVFPVTKETFDEFKGKKSSSFFEYDFNIKGPFRVALVARPCRSCYIRF